LLKAASYLMHGNHFNHVREFLLNNSNVVLEDDSGIPYRFFTPDKWSMQFFGRYLGPIGTFKQHPQPDLARAFAEANPPPLEFAFGYQWHPSRSSLIVARPKVAPDSFPKAEPADDSQ
jgi:hypothetical protein